MHHTFEITRLKLMWFAARQYAVGQRAS